VRSNRICMERNVKSRRLGIIKEKCR
jgi:hypothetical protein